VQARNSKKKESPVDQGGRAIPLEAFASQSTPERQKPYSRPGAYSRMWGRQKKKAGTFVSGGASEGKTKDKGTLPEGKTTPVGLGGMKNFKNRENFLNKFNQPGEGGERGLEPRKNEKKGGSTRGPGVPGEREKRRKNISWAATSHPRRKSGA